MKQTSFSIIIPVYNTELIYIKQTIESVINIDYENYEIIIIDDGSCKEVYDLVDSFKTKCHVVHQTNKGEIVACLEGVKIAHNDYVIIVDCDDIINSNSLNIYNDILMRNKVDVIMHDFVIFHDSINKITKHTPHFNEGVVSKEEAMKQLCLLNTSTTWSRTARRELYNGMIDYLDTTLKNGDDTQMSAYILKNANSFYYTNEVIYYYRVVEKHKDYYDITNLNDSNFLLPVYNILFKNNHEYDYLLTYFKTSIANSHVYNAFRICLWINDKEKRNSLLDQLNNLPITEVANNINVDIPIVSSILYGILTKKHYRLISILSRIYDRLYSMQKL